MTLPPRARTTVDMAARFPPVVGHRFAIDARDLAPAPPPEAEAGGIVVERATYWDSSAGHWAAGAVVRATPW